MNISVRSLPIAVIGAVVTSLLQPWILDNGWTAITTVLLVGCFFTLVQRETKARQFLIPLFVSSLVFSVLVAGILFFRELLTNTGRGPLFIPTPLSLTDISIIAGACLFLSFMGGLVGIAAKALYALYGKKLSTIILVVGPLVLTIASLGIAKTRVGGTIMSAYHGWPYPYLTYQLKDILDGFIINRWSFSPGSLWHNILFDYAIFFSLLFALSFGIQKINARTKKQHDFVLWSSALILILSLTFFSSLPIQKAFVLHEITKAQSCKEDAECIVVQNIGYYACGLAMNTKDQSRITSLVNRFPWPYFDPSCVQENPHATCMEQRCQITVDQPNEYAWEKLRTAIKYCNVAAITQSHDRHVIAILKKGYVIKAIEPNLDDIFTLIKASGCPEIPMATE